MATNESDTTEPIEDETEAKELEVEIVETIDDAAETFDAVDETDVSEKVAAALEGAEATAEAEAELDEKVAEALEVEVEELTVEVKDDIDEALEALTDTVEEIRVKHLHSVGLENVDTLEDGEFLCSKERKMLKGEPCQFCRGGCSRENTLPGLLDVELQATTDLKGVVLNSGYSPESDVFLLNVEREDGSVVEAAYSGEGKALGWLLLDQELISRKDALAGQKIISLDAASEIAVKQLGGYAVAVEGAIFEGYDSYVVQIEDPEGKSYDAYVGLDGTFLGYDDLVSDQELKEKAMTPDGEPPDDSEDVTKLVGQVEGITDAKVLTSVVEAIGEDADVVPDELRKAIIAKAEELDSMEILPAAWADGEDAVPAEAAPAAPAAPAAVAPAAPAAAILPEKKVLVGDEEDEDLAVALAEFEQMIGTGEETE